MFCHWYIYIICINYEGVQIYKLLYSIYVYTKVLFFLTVVIFTSIIIRYKYYCLFVYLYTFQSKISISIIYTSDLKVDIFEKTLDFKYIPWKLRQNSWNIEFFHEYYDFTWKLAVFVKTRTFFENVNFWVS